MGIKRETKVEFDAINERVIIGSAMCNRQTLRKLCQIVQTDHFQAKEHRHIWNVLREISRSDTIVAPTINIVRQLDPTAPIDYLQEVIDEHPEVDPNLDQHLDRLDWDRARIQAIMGPISSIIETVQDPSADPEKVKSLAKQLASHFDSYKSTAYLRDPEELVECVMRTLEDRRNGRAVYPYGILGLDKYEADENGCVKQRMSPGAAPGQCTVVAGVPGCGKSTFVANMVIQLALQKRKILYGSWEMNAPITLELLACIRLGFNRTDLLHGNINEVQQKQLYETMMKMSKYIRFFDNPFNRKKKQRSNNDMNLDIIQATIESSGCDVFVADLWRRALVDLDPSAEEQALIRQQAICEETKVHAILVQQLRAKDLEQRNDQRPTRESIKGSGGWIEIPDTIMCLYRPALAKPTNPDQVIEAHILKQRFGKWPIAVEFDWNPDLGKIDNGRTLPMDQLVNNEIDVDIGKSFRVNSSKFRKKS